MKRELGEMPERPFVKLDGVVNRFIEVAKNRMLLICALFSKFVKYWLYELLR